MNCPKCSKEIPDDSILCPYCVEPIKALDAPASPKPSAAPGGSPSEIDQGKGIAWLSYVGILFLIPLLAMKDNAYTKFHAKQGLVLFIGEVIVGILGRIPFVGWFIIGPVGGLFFFVLSIIGIVKSLQGEYWKAPFGIGNIAEGFKF
jgi:uncharacterized membrane protein